MLTVFTDAIKERAALYTGIWGRPLLAVLCLEHSDAWDRARNQIDTWFASFPAGNKINQIKRDFLSFNDRHHLGAFFELAAFYLIDSLNINIRPNNGEIDEYPEYFIEIDGQEYCFEVTTIQLSNDEEKIKKACHTLISAIESECTDHNYHLSLHVTRLNPPLDGADISEICRKLSQSLDRFSEWDDSYQGTKVLRINNDSLVADITLTSQSSGNLSIGGFTPPVTGGSSEEAQYLISERLRTKARTHRKVHPDMGLVIFLGFAHDSFSNITGIWRGFHALTGYEHFQLSIDNATGIPIEDSLRVNINTQKGLTTPTFQKDGGIDEPHYKEITGVIDAERHFGWKFDLEYTPNLFGTHPLLEFDDLPSRIKKINRNMADQITSFETQEIEPLIINFE
ncbi:hypothetical protein KAU08_05695 [bacterium]|nr:hypothetical protein [bacterium]